jgi:hypothetical protein
MQTRAAEVGKGLARNSSHGSDFGGLENGRRGTGGRKRGPRCVGKQSSKQQRGRARLGWRNTRDGGRQMAGG